jgi:hypothetical protein
MQRDTDLFSKTTCLLANGSSGRWDVAVDESVDGSDLSMELENGPVYLFFKLQSLENVRQAFAYLRSGPDRSRRDDEQSLRLGHFGSSTVSLIWDDEDPLRCFLVIGPSALSTLRLTLDGEDIRSLLAALEQVVEDLPPEPNG